MSRVSPKWFGSICAAAALCVAPAFAQYPGRVSEQQQNGTHLRATAVLEYTGDLKHPNASRLIPIAVWDGMRYQPGGLYLADPEPLTLESGTQYVLETAGRPEGFFDVGAAGQVNGLWLGMGHYQAPPVVAKLPNSRHMPRVVQDYDPDKPHFAHVPSDYGTDSAQTTAQKAPPVDPNRPTLHERPAGSSADSSNTPQTSSQSSNRASIDPDRPIMREPTPPSKTSSNTSSSTGSTPSETATAGGDPNRPHLSYGVPAEMEKIDKPDALTGVPVEMKQTVGISDARSMENESYAYSWANPDDENKMKSDLELIAEKAVAPPLPTPAPDTKTSHGTHRKAPLPQAPKLPMLADEQFRAYGLSFGGGATMVLSARTVGAPVKYITIIAQPDFYGNPQVLLKHVATQGELDVTPRMRLVDAADTSGLGRADLIFELRGATYRQFAIYRIAGGSATQAFVTQPAPIQ